MQDGTKLLVSIVILNYRRRTDLIRALRSVESQTYHRREVVVVDNNSGDGTPAFLAQEFPTVRVVPLDENLGCGGRNRGVESASGEIAVTIDNDICLQTPDDVAKIVSIFERRPEATALVFKVLDENGKLLLRDWCHPRSARKCSDQEFETCFISEGACAFRRSDFLKLGGYYEPFYIGREGWDLALRMLDAHMPIVYCPQIAVRHYMSRETRSGRRPYYFYARNNIWIAFRNYAGARRWRFIAYSTALIGFYCLKSPRGTVDVLRGLRDGLRSVSHLTRTKISERTWQQLAEIRAHRPALWRRVLAHFGDSEI
jgi:GT2 family glycosyltransferase